MEIRKGEIVCLLGGNASGKSTTMKTVIGSVRPAKGSVWYEGEDITNWNTSRRVAHGIAIVPEARRIFPRLTVLENLMMGAFIRNDKTEIDADLARVMDMFPRLKERRTSRGTDLSGGEQQMLAIGRALMAAPQVLLADELSLGLAPIVVRQVFAKLDEVRKAGVTVLVVEQNARLAMKFADYLYVLKYGRVVMEGARETFERSTSLVDAYLGA